MPRPARLSEREKIRTAIRIFRQVHDQKQVLKRLELRQARAVESLGKYDLECYLIETEQIPPKVMKRGPYYKHSKLEDNGIKEISI